MKQLLQNKILHYTLILAFGLLLGWWIFGSSGEEYHQHSEAVAEETIWTCSMHPQIRQNEPGKCPICGMDLIPLTSSSDAGSDDPFIHTMSPQAAALANIQTTKVSSTTPEYVVYLTGKIVANEQKLATITADYSGRIEKLFIDFTGQTVNKGQKLATIYSPELVTAQKELIEAAKNKHVNPSLYNAVKEKLRLWKITDKQIDAIETSGEVLTEFDVYANITGIVVTRDVSRGDYVNKGSVLFEIADLSSIWVMLDAYEQDLAWVKVGSKVNFTVASLPGKEFASTVTFVDPILNQQTRTASIRAEANNLNLQLKPGMFVNGIIQSKPSGSSKNNKELIVPKTSVLWTGKRSVVYVKIPNADSPTFEMREVILGSRIGEAYIIESGLTEGEEIVTNGVFAVDAAAQLNGKYSMMNRPESKRFTVNSDFKSQLTQTVKNYFSLKDAFVESHVEKVKKESQKVLQSINNVDMSLLKDEPHNKWMELESRLIKSLESINKTQDIEEQRKQFETISEIVIEASELFGLTIEIVYVQFCPMAFDDKGAYWLSESEEIRNPYFGDMMLSCGEVTKKIRSIDSYKTSEEKTNRQSEHQH